MIDIGTPVRKAFFDAINENIEINGGKISIVDEKLDDKITVHDLYVLIGAQNEEDRSNKTNWVGEVDIVITIYNRLRSSSTKTIIEEIAKQILTIVFPTRTTLGISVQDPYSIVWARPIQRDYTFEKLDTGFEIGKRFSFRLRITQ